MPGETGGIRSRLAVFSGAALGGVYWALVGLLVAAHERGGPDTPAVLPGDLLIVIATSLLILFAGSGLLVLSRPAARTAGVALVLCSLSGWIVIVTVALQSWFWRL